MTKATDDGAAHRTSTEAEIVQIGPDPSSKPATAEDGPTGPEPLAIETQPFLDGLHLLPGSPDLPAPGFFQVSAGRELAQPIASATHPAPGAGSSPPHLVPSQGRGEHGRENDGWERGINAPAPQGQSPAALGAGDQVTSHGPAPISQVIQSGGNLQLNELIIQLAPHLDGAALGNTTMPAADVQALSADLWTLAEPGHTPGLEIDRIAGDYASIVDVSQSNIMFDEDQNLQAALAFLDPADAALLGQATVSGSNSLVNEAILHTGMQYDIIAVMGNYYEYNIIIQINLIIDQDLNALLLTGDGEPGSGSAEGGQGLASGGNVQSNDAAIVDSNSGGGLQLVGGQYSEVFLASQTSLIRDGDLNSILADLGPQSLFATMNASFVTSGGNTQTNRGRFGSEEVAPGEPQVDLAKGLGRGAVLEMQDNLGRPLRALFVDGDYYDVNMIVQINILKDGDINAARAQGGGRSPHAHGDGLSADGFVTLDFDQLVDTGHNATANHAVIIDDNGGFQLMIVGGNYVETNVIHQENILVDGDANVAEAARAHRPAPAGDEIDQAALHHHANDLLHTLSG
ncbi:hypothetical protein QNA08_05660 [Chelatococcus sp. SYSU_G07232]|uniref:Uncharacterized protein n=1 Tax=Chelatococcus albus TaxID=3047466 RepID=A0ABT7AEB6_9HYPH|nr:hypothetical protein [Chelatococcus sp. SYSU_G07232]MDJ1157715.1 hypothetical protein [Chelatococcus sp. SYSU_G07232]